jgi:PAS domain S-box-containing protein
LRGVPSTGYSTSVNRGERELRLYRKLCLFVGAMYLAWWFAVELLLPDSYNPLLGRLGVVVTIWAIVAASYASAWVRRHMLALWMCGLWLLTAHYFYLFYMNSGDVDWVIGSFITVTAVSLAMMTRTSLLAYSVFTVALSLGLVVAMPGLRSSVFVPGLLTVLLQANIGLNSRLGVLRDLVASNAHFQLLFDSTFEGVLIHDGGTIVQVNDALVRMFGFAREDMVGSDAISLVHPDHQAGADGLLIGTASPLELQCVRKDGAVIDVEVRGKPLLYRKRQQQLVTVEDVTERKQRAAELLRTNKALLEQPRSPALRVHRLARPPDAAAEHRQLRRPAAVDLRLRTRRAGPGLAGAREQVGHASPDADRRPARVLTGRREATRVRASLDARGPRPRELVARHGSA